MTEDDTLMRLIHMLDYSKEAVDMAQARSRADLDTDRMFNLALVRLIEVVGEAASKVVREFRLNHPEVPWRVIVDTRNQLIHGYDDIDFDEVWLIIQDDLPPLISQLQAIVTAARHSRQPC